MSGMYDVIVVGARCAGSPTAMLLARRGYRVLLVDRATFPSDTISTHVVQPRGVSALSKWGLLDRLVATGCPPVATFAFDFGLVTITGPAGPAESPVAYCPRRTVLDKLLVDAAVEAGAEIREGFSIESLVTDNGRVTGIKGRARGGTLVTERAAIVVGADGWQSLVASQTGAERYHEKPTLLAAYYSYWSGLPLGSRFEFFVRPARGFGAAPTHDGLTVIFGGWPIAEFAANKEDVEGHFLKMIDLVPAFAERVRAARREARFAGALVPNYFRTPYGPGWALVGDAGYIKDAITAQGITDAFCDAEQCSSALDESLSGARPFGEAMADYQRARDTRVRAMYEQTLQAAMLEPPPAELQRLLLAIKDSEAMEGFLPVNAGAISPAEFFSRQNVGAMMAAARTAT